jgi:hypothetical protein
VETEGTVGGAPVPEAIIKLVFAALPKPFASPYAHATETLVAGLEATPEQVLLDWHMTVLPQVMLVADAAVKVPASAADSAAARAVCFT